jgi:hypothetical protein
MDPAAPRDVTFHLLASYEGLLAVDRNPLPTGETRMLHVEVYPDEYVWAAAERALAMAEQTQTVLWLRKQMQQDAGYLTALRPAGTRIGSYGPDEDEAWLYYTIDPDGSLRQHPWLDHRFMTLAEVEQVTGAGYLHADPHQYVIHGPEGFGGDFGLWDVAGWLYEQGVDIAGPLARDGVILWTIDRLTRRLRNSRADRRARRAAWEWTHQNIEAPFQLRQFLDTKPDWTRDEVDIRLFKHVNPKAAKQLLVALGYESDAGGTWRLGTSKKAIRKRARWLKAEEREGF